MHNLKLPIFFRPSEIVFVDDNQSFLNNLALVLPNTFHYKTFTNSVLGLEYVKNKLTNKVENHSNDIVVVQDEDASSLEINLEAVYLQIFNPERFNFINLCITDYTMPDINGLEFCEAIRDYNCHKILLTGDASHDLAVKAFNQNTIQKFILKDSVDYTKAVVDAISEHRFLYFLHQSNLIINNMVSTNLHKLEFLYDDKFAEYFFEASQNIGIIEYYMLDTHGSYLMLDMKGNPTWYIVREANEMDNIIRSLEYEEAPPEIIAKIKDFSHIPFFFSDEDYQTLYEDWDPYLQPVIKTLHSQDKIYYISIVNHENSPYKLDKPFLGYKKYLETL